MSTTHYTEAERALERANYIANADPWIGDRGQDVATKLLEAQVHATLALAEATAEAGNAHAKAIYDGRI